MIQRWMKHEFHSLSMSVWKQSGIHSRLANAEHKGVILGIWHFLSHTHPTRCVGNSISVSEWGRKLPKIPLWVSGRTHNKHRRLFRNLAVECTLCLSKAPCVVLVFPLWRGSLTRGSGKPWDTSESLLFRTDLCSAVCLSQKKLLYMRTRHAHT